MTFKELWKKHGTKVLGYGAAMIGTLLEIDHETVDAISGLLGSTWGPRVKLGFFIGAGLATAYRGHGNTVAAAAAESPPPPTAGT